MHASISTVPARTSPTRHAARADGVAVGVQLVAPPGREDLLIDLGAQLEGTHGPVTRPEALRRPKFHGSRGGL